jgi:dual specificity tyrosine-phosphorylation-regulated kinase 2/3/4
MAVRPKLLLELVINLCKALALLSECEVVHSDLKTENILLKVDGEGSTLSVKDVKLIDYGSSFEFRNLAQFSMATPEYMPPEILNYIIHENGGEYEEDLYQHVMENYKHPWAVDMWSLGCVLLEIVVGVPLWMSLPLLVPGRNGSWLQKEGLFAVKGRLFPEIIKKQRHVNPFLD